MLYPIFILRNVFGLPHLIMYLWLYVYFFLSFKIPYRSFIILFIIVIIIHRMCRSSISLPLSLEKNHLSLSQIVYTNFRNCRCSIVWLTLLLFKSSKPSSFSNFFITLSLASNYLVFWSYRIWSRNYWLRWICLNLPCCVSKTVCDRFSEIFFSFTFFFSHFTLFSNPYLKIRSPGNRRL